MPKGWKEGTNVVIEIKTAFPVEWGREYYTVESKEKRVFAPCVACDNTGKITIKGEEYTCPRCKGNWREKEVVGSTTVYSVGKWVLVAVEEKSPGPCGGRRTVLTFQRSNGGTAERRYDAIYINGESFDTMETQEIGRPRKLYDDYKTALAEVKRLNEKEKEK